MSFATIPEVLEAIRAGKMVVVVDDEDRENEGDIILAADHVTPEAINFMVTHARGLVCLTITEARARQLGLGQMAHDNTSPNSTAFTISIGVAARSVSDTFDHLFERADKALYDAKTGGRNRVVMA